MALIKRFTQLSLVNQVIVVYFGVATVATVVNAIKK